MRTNSFRIAAILVSLTIAAAVAQTRGPILQHQQKPPAVQAAIPQWVWLRGAAPTDRVFLRQAFRLADFPELVKLQVAARGRFSVYINGGLLVRANPTDEYQTLFLTPYVIKGSNVLAIACDSGADPPGIRFDLTVNYKGGRSASVISNGDERVSRERLPDWEKPAFDDRAWSLAVPVASRSANARPAQGQTLPAAPAYAGPPVNYDYGRLVRIWDIDSGGRDRDNPYTRRRAPGERMVLSAGSSTPSAYGLLTSEGFTLLESSSDHLSTDEVSPGVWDFSRLALEAFRDRQAGFDASYFPHFAFPPPWYRDSNPFTRIECLEHEQPVQAFSPWEPKMPLTAERGFDQLVRKFRGGELLDGLYLGIHGDFGEAGLLSGARVATPTLRDSWERRFGNAHDHLGWWCADPLAQADFRTKMIRKYHDLDAVNLAWSTRFSTREEIRYPASPTDGSRRYWLDFVEWYLGSTSDLASRIESAARKSFPDSLLMLPMGFADENPRGGNDNSLLARDAAEHRVDVRSTHAGYRPFAESQAGPMGRIASAARYYGAPFWSEPPGRLTAEQETARIFAAASFGSKGMFDWTENIQDHRDLYYRYGKYLTVQQPIVDVAMLFPSTSHLLRGNGYPPTFEKGCTEIRDVLNYDILDERMIRDGALDKFRVLVMWEGAIVEAETLSKIRDWVQSGGVIAAYDFGKIETVEGDRTWFSDVFGYAGKLKPAAAQLRYESAGPAQNRYRITPALAGSAPFLSGDWYPAEGARSTSRWTGASAEVRIPVEPGRRFTLLIRAAFPPETVRNRREVLVNGVKVGDLDAPEETTYSFNVPPAAVGGSTNAAIVTIRSETWTPADILRGSTDRRPLGTSVDYVQVEPASTLAPATEPGPPSGRFLTSIDLSELRADWAKPYGKGWTVYYPARRTQLAGYYEVIRYLTYHLSDLDSTKRDALAVDDAWDGVYATQFADKVLYYNSGAAQVKRSIVLPPDTGALSSRPRTAGAVSVTVEPNSITPLYLESPPQEMLYQCEGFKALGGLRPSTGATYSPGQGLTHVLIPSGGQIETRIQCDVPGRYRVFYRAVRRGVKAVAVVLMDGRPLDRERSPRTRGLPAVNGTILAGSVELTQGVHTLTLRPRPGDDIRADFVILATDPNIGGYGFAVSPGAIR